MPEGRGSTAPFGRDPAWAWAEGANGNGGFAVGNNVPLDFV
jgi:hypothetical protein